MFWRKGTTYWLEIGNTEAKSRKWDTAGFGVIREWGWGRGGFHTYVEMGALLKVFEQGVRACARA